MPVRGDVGGGRDYKDETMGRSLPLPFEHPAATDRNRKCCGAPNDRDVEAMMGTGEIMFI